MWLAAVVLVLAGALVLGLTMVPGVVAWQTPSFVRQMRLPAPAGKAMLAGRMRQRDVGAGVGLVVGGVLLAAIHVITPGAGSVTVVLVVGFAAAVGGVAVTEIWRPGAAVPGAVRTARVPVPRQTDYLPTRVVVATWVLAAAALGTAVLALLLGLSPWFASDVLTAGTVPVVAGSLVLLGVLTAWATRRVLRTPEPAHDEVELFVQDAVRASTLLTLHVPLALLALLSVPLLAVRVDDAASAIALAQGAVGPGWVGGLLIALYLLAPVAIVGVLVMTLPVWQDTGQSRFRNRLWSGRVPGRVAT